MGELGEAGKKHLLKVTSGGGKRETQGLQSEVACFQGCLRMTVFPSAPPKPPGTEDAH